MQVKALHDTRFLEKGRVYHATLNSWGLYDIIIDGIVRTFPTAWFEKRTRKEHEKMKQKQMKNKNIIYEMPSYVTLLSEGDVSKVIFNEEKGVTVVKLNDGTKATARCSEHDVFCRETGFRVAYAKAEIKQLKKMIKDREEFIARV